MKETTHPGVTSSIPPCRRFTTIKCRHRAAYNRDRCGAMGSTALLWPARILICLLRVYMVKVSYEQKPYRRAIIETYGGNVFASPSNSTNIGRSILEKDPGNTGSLGTAISEAVEVATSTPKTRATASVLL